MQNKRKDNMFFFVIRTILFFKMAPPKKHAQKVGKAKAPITKQVIILYISSLPQGMSSIC